MDKAVVAFLALQQQAAGLQPQLQTLPSLQSQPSWQASPQSWPGAAAYESPATLEILQMLRAMQPPQVAPTQDSEEEQIWEYLKLERRQKQRFAHHIEENLIKQLGQGLSYEQQRRVLQSVSDPYQRVAIFDEEVAAAAPLIAKAKAKANGPENRKE
ncbi:hypothetical protein F4860DRAFT_392242 [Xylaria cubensis]|nr:hypothetical protein F4860DRAFT_392242 [Xylaria cubensis]